MVAKMGNLSLDAWQFSLGLDPFWIAGLSIKRWWLVAVRTCLPFVDVWFGERLLDSGCDETFASR